MKITAIRAKTRFWRPGDDYLKDIFYVVKNAANDGDILAISEKALSTAKGRIIDEEKVEPSILAKFLARIWIRRLWAGQLGRLVNFKEKTLENLARYPISEGAAHKQVALWYAGFLQTLRHYSEGGIDASNLPFKYVSLPLENPKQEADRIRYFLERRGKKISVMIVDGDTTHSYRNLHMAPRKTQVPHMFHFGGFMTFFFGRLLGFKARATPLALSGIDVNPDRGLWLAELAHDVSGPGAGRTVWSMADKLDTKLTEVTWEMIERFDHAPMVLLRIH